MDGEGASLEPVEAEVSAMRIFEPKGLAALPWHNIVSQLYASYLQLFIYLFR